MGHWILKELSSRLCEFSGSSLSKPLWQPTKTMLAQGIATRALACSLVHSCTTPNVLEASFSRMVVKRVSFNFHAHVPNYLSTTVGVGGVTPLSASMSNRISPPFLSGQRCGVKSIRSQHNRVIEYTGWPLLRRPHAQKMCQDSKEG